MKTIILNFMLVLLTLTATSDLQADVSQQDKMVIERSAPLYFHPYMPVINSGFQLQPGQGFNIIEPFSGFSRMVQVCVRDARSTGPMPVPTPMLATRVTRGKQVLTSKVPVGSCVILEGDRISLGLADGTVDADNSESNPRAALSFMSGTYSVLGYYSRTKPRESGPLAVPEK